MYFTTVLLTALANTTFALSIQRSSSSSSLPKDARLPACNFDPVTCACPANTKYQAAVSTAVYPVAPSVISQMTDNFFNATWWGGTLAKTEGSPNAPGAKRYFSATLPGAKAAQTVVEELNSLTMGSDGGYTMQVGLTNVPFTYPTTTGTGYIGGTWETISVAADGKNAKMVFDSHVCFSETDDLAGFQKASMDNIMAMLKKQGNIPESATVTVTSS